MDERPFRTKAGKFEENKSPSSVITSIIWFEICQVFFSQKNHFKEQQSTTKNTVKMQKRLQKFVHKSIQRIIITSANKKMGMQGIEGKRLDIQSSTQQLEDEAGDQLP